MPCNAVFKFAALCWAMSASAYANERTKGRCLEIAVFENPVVSSVLVPALNELYEAAGLCSIPKYMSSNRARELVVHGFIDGDLARTQTWVEKHRDAIVALKIPIGKLNGAAMWVEGLVPEPQGVSSLNDKKIATIKGFEWPLALAKNNNASLIEVVEVNQLPKLLYYERVDYVLADYLILKHWKANHQAPVFEKTRVKTIYQTDYYHILALKNQPLATRLEETLERLGGSSYFEKYIAKTLQRTGDTNEN
jgi:ABC-type amino acid transport substrate-binding protein